MKISFHGAAQMVTGSKHLIILNNGNKYLLDCGMFQGLGAQTAHLNQHWGFEPGELDCLILSHAHIDHSGLIPKLVKDGFKGKIYATPATRELACVLLEDSAQIQNQDSQHDNTADALYGLQDVKTAMKHFVDVNYNEWIIVDESTEFKFTDAGHLIGSAAAHFKINESGETKTLTFSGDVGRFRNTILHQPQEFPHSDVIILESTYGDSTHELGLSTPDALLKQITHTCLHKKGKLIIPAFSVGRTQELLFALNQLENEKRLPALKYFVDSPLSQKATTIIRSYPTYFKESVQNILSYDTDVFTFKGLEFSLTPDDSMRLQEYEEPCVIIAASGMADAGRIRYHIRDGVQNAANTILLVGYCDPESLGGKLMNGAEGVNVLGDGYDVRAEVAVIKSLSAHGDSDDLVRFLSCQDASQVQQLFLVHGEPKVQEKFKRRLELKGFDTVIVPALHEQFDVGGVASAKGKEHVA